MNKHKNSLPVPKRLMPLISALLLLLPSPLHADSIKQMNLREMCQWADKVFRGTVVSAVPGAVPVGGGQLPVVTYRIRVDEAFKGDFQTVKGIRFTEVRMLGASSLKNGGQSRIVTGPTPHDTFPRPPTFAAGHLETMSATVSIPGIGMETPHADDRAMISALYSEPDYSSNSGTIRGRILGHDARTPVNGVGVVARNVANPFEDAVSAISGNFAASDAPEDPLAGVYILNGLTPGAQYAVYVDQILIGQLSFRPTLPGPEEFYNGARESNNFTADDPPGEFTPLTAVAGSPLTGIDIIFNRLRPGPIPIEAFLSESPQVSSIAAEARMEDSRSCCTRRT